MTMDLHLYIPVGFINSIRKVTKSLVAACEVHVYACSVYIVIVMFRANLPVGVFHAKPTHSFSNLVQTYMYFMGRGHETSLNTNGHILEVEILLDIFVTFSLYALRLMFDAAYLAYPSTLK